MLEGKGYRFVKVRYIQNELRYLLDYIELLGRIGVPKGFGLSLSGVLHPGSLPMPEDRLLELDGLALWAGACLDGFYEMR